MVRALAAVVLASTLAGGLGAARDAKAEGSPAWGVRYIVDYAEFELLRVNREEWSKPYIDRQGRHIVVGLRSGRLESRSVSRGEIVWSRTDVGAIGAEMDDWNGNLLVGIDSDLAAIDSDTGGDRWRLDLGGRIAGPIARAGDLAVIPIRPNSFVAVDLTEPAIRWRQKRPTPDDLTVRGQAGAWIDARRDLAALGFSDGTLLGVSLSRGDTKWVVRLGEAGEFFRDVDTTPVAVDDGRSLVVASYNGGIYKIDAERGGIIYERPLKSIHGIVRAAPRDELVLSSGDGVVLGFDATQGTVKWRYRVQEGFPTAPISAGDGLVFVGTSKGALSLLDGRTGEPQQVVAPGSGVSTPVMVRGEDGVVLSNKSLVLVLGRSRGVGVSGVRPVDPGPAEDFGRRHAQ